MHAFDVLADPVRRRILELLAEGEHASGEVVEVIAKEFGISQAAEWIYTGRVFGAEEALAGRLVSRVVAPDTLLPAADHIIRQTVQQPAIEPRNL